MERREAQSARAVLMIRPTRFHSNPQTADSNAFQSEPDASRAAEEQALALGEFDALASALRGAGVDVHVYDDTPDPATPDAIFPNNWISLHADGTVVLYPMMAENRRWERRTDIVKGLSQSGFRISDTIDLSPHEREGRYLESTGSLVMDRVHRIAYACLSPRTDLDALGEFGQRLDYEILAFHAVGTDGNPIYHTNVMMSVGGTFAVICSAAISDAGQREAVLTKLRETDHEVVEITPEQMLEFAGNVLELENDRGEKILAMSRRAEAALSAEQRQALSRHAQIVAAPVDTIETSAGGGVRCMLAEIHLPRK